MAYDHKKIMHTTNGHTYALIVLHNAITLKITEILNVRILHMTKQHKTQEAYRLGRGTMPESGQQQKTMHHKQNNSINTKLSAIKVHQTGTDTHITHWLLKNLSQCNSKTITDDNLTISSRRNKHNLLQMHQSSNNDAVRRCH